jgi:hypothetical protein
MKPILNWLRAPAISPSEIAIALLAAMAFIAMAALTR